MRRPGVGARVHQETISVTNQSRISGWYCNVTVGSNSYALMRTHVYICIPSEEDQAPSKVWYNGAIANADSAFF